MIIVTSFHFLLICWFFIWVFFKASLFICFNVSLLYSVETNIIWQLLCRIRILFYISDPKFNRSVWLERIRGVFGDINDRQYHIQVCITELGRKEWNIHRSWVQSLCRVDSRGRCNFWKSWLMRACI